LYRRDHIAPAFARRVGARYRALQIVSANEIAAELGVTRWASG